MFRIAIPVAILMICITRVQGDDSVVKAERNPERRSALALEQADADLDAARKAYAEGKLTEFRQHAGAVSDMVELSYRSLDESGKKARRSPKWFKRAEQHLVILMRRLDSLARDVSVEDRETVQNLQKRVSAVHDRVLQDIMSKK